MRTWALAAGACIWAAVTPAAAQDAARPGSVGTISWCGRSHNVTGGARSSVRIAIRPSEDGALEAEGQWPNAGLYGHFLGESELGYGCAEGRICLQFAGSLDGLGAAGFPEDTKVAMVIALDMAADRSGARGVYRIEAIPPGYPMPQYGILELGPCEIA